ncbi:scolexin B isoform X2 [Plutella xylostella]|uniref:scolexin B isoform X2 n=1 Tax=Plutella xylostella TaxID=51655 RepID=UPI0020328DA2|nr:scolexin B isoform X2 [Plutella xylostella]
MIHKKVKFVGARRACGAVMLAGARVSSVWAVLAVAAVAAAAVAARQLADTSQGQDLPRCIDRDTGELTKQSGRVKKARAKVGAKAHLQHPHAVLFASACGATVLSPTWLITSAHCTLFMKGSTVIAGTGRQDDGSGHRAEIKRLVVHPRFTIGPYWLSPTSYNIKQVAARYDFMLVELEEPLPLDKKNIRAASLAAPSARSGRNVGYGGYGAKFHGGDSGSGLVDDSGRLLGVVSWVEGDATSCFPGAIVVFARVSAARDWIREVTGL